MPILANIKLKAAEAFAKIGTKNGTAMPESRDNRANIAYEYFIADALASMATKRKDTAKKAAQEAGILLDEEGIPGSTVTTYENEYLNISAKTANPAERLDKAKLSSILIREVGEAKARQIIEAATVQNKAATSYIFSER